MLSLPPAFVLSQDQTLKFETALRQSRSSPDMIALRTLTRCHVLSMLPSKLWLSINANDRCFGCPWFPTNRQDTRRLRFSFFLLRCQRAGRIFTLLLNRQKNQLAPFWAVPASFASCIRIRQGAFALSSSARPFSDGGYMRRQVRVSSALS